MREIRLTAEQRANRLRQTPHLGFRTSALDSDVSRFHRQLTRQMPPITSISAAFWMLFQYFASRIQTHSFAGICKIHHGNVRQQIAILAHSILAVYRFSGHLPGILVASSSLSACCA